MDWDGDGLTDLVVGNRLGTVNWFRRLPDSTLTAMPPLSTPDGRIDAGHNSAPEVADWNSDGLPDLILGRSNYSPGSVVLFLNTGAPGDPVLGDSCFLKAGGSNISHVYSVPRVFDLDSDGLDDLLLGECTGHVYWFRNVGSADDPVLEEGVVLECETGPVHNNTESRVWAGDYDADGVPDLLVGDYDGLVRLYRGSDTTGVVQGPPPALRITPRASPCRGRPAFSVLSSGCGQATLKVFSADGRLAVRRSLEISAGRSPLYLEAALPAGVYVAVLSAGGGSASCTAVLMP